MTAESQRRQRCFPTTLSGRSAQAVARDTTTIGIQAANVPATAVLVRGALSRFTIGRGASELRGRRCGFGRRRLQDRFVDVLPCAGARNERQHAKKHDAEVCTLHQSLQFRDHSRLRKCSARHAFYEHGTNCYGAQRNVSGRPAGRKARKHRVGVTRRNRPARERCTTPRLASRALPPGTPTNEPLEQLRFVVDLARRSGTLGERKRAVGQRVRGEPWAGHAHVVHRRAVRLAIDGSNQQQIGSSTATADRRSRDDVGIRHLRVWLDLAVREVAT